MAEINRKSHRLYHYLAFLVPLVLLSIAYPTFWTAPNSHLLGVEGDALKNVYTFAYHAKYGSGTHFEGMNHPYGECVVFTDNQPIISMAVSWLSKIWPGEIPIIGIFNWLMVLGIILAVYFTFRIFRFYELAAWKSLVGALIIVALCPQIDRIDVHFSLAYIFFIPLTWWLTLYWIKNPEKKWIRYVFIINFFLQPFVHLYYLLINLFIIGPLVLFAYIDQRKKKWKENWPVIRPLAYCLVLALMVVVAMKAIDPVSDRPENPYGVQTYLTTPQGTLYPMDGILSEWIDPVDIKWEGQGYMGILAIPLLPLLLFISFRRLFKDQSKKWMPSKWMAISVCSGVLVFLYSSGYLNALGLKYLNEIIPPLKQFRSLGRLAWVTYFFIGTTLIYFLFKVWEEWSEDPKMKKWVWLPVFGLVLYTWEAGSQFDLRTRPWIKEDVLQHHPEIEELKTLLSQNGKSFEDFDALWGLPSTLLGPELIQLQRGHHFMNKLMPLSYQSGLPIVNWMMSRTSLSQTMDYLELFTPTYVEKERAKLLEDQKLLIMYREDHCASYEKRTAAKGQSIGRTGKTEWLELKANDLFNKSKHDSLIQWIENNPDTLSPTHHLNFNEESGESFAGNHGKWLEGEQVIWSGNIPQDQIYECSFWVKITPASKRLPRIYFRKKSPDGKVLYESQYDFNQQAVAQNGWLRVEWSFDAASSSDNFEIVCKSEGVSVDEFIAHPKKQNAVSRSGDDLLWRNFKL